MMIRIDELMMALKSVLLNEMDGFPLPIVLPVDQEKQGSDYVLIEVDGGGEVVDGIYSFDIDITVTMVSLRLVKLWIGLTILLG
ncbi:MAG: hypothetical protein RSF35_09590 [Akkermansia sp.]